MNIVKARVQWLERFSNLPHFEILVDEFPSASLRYVKRGVLYYGELSGAVQFKSYSGPGEGYGGCRWPITLLDGTVVEMIGPWSASCYAVNGDSMYRHFAVDAAKYGIEASGQPCATMSWTSEPDAFERGYTFMGGCALALPQLQQCAHLAGCHLLVVGYEGPACCSDLSAEQLAVVNVNDRSDIRPWHFWSSIPRGVAFSFCPSLDPDKLVKGESKHVRKW